MDATILQKTDFIKFNVSSRLKALAAKKASAHGMTLSELGRMLFGVYVTDLTMTPASQKLIKMAEEAKRNHREGKGTLIETYEGMEDFLKIL